MHKLIIIICFLKISSFGFSQKAAFSVGIQLPLKYDIGFEYKLHEKISTNLNFGILTKPFDESILGILKMFGLEQGYVDMIGNSFEFGLVSDLGFRFHHKKNYFGVFGQNIYLFAQDTPKDLAESYLNVDIDSYKKNKLGSNIDVDTDAALQSNLFQAGILYGRRFELRNPKIELRLEFSASANMFSKSKFFIEGIETIELSELIDNELKPIYKDYTYIPTINFYYIYKFQHKKI